MGYSCRHEAGECLDFIMRTICINGSSNTWSFKKDTYFFERGRENEDGSITGSVWKIDPATNHCRRSGGVKIAPCGRLERFPHIPPTIRTEAQEKRNRGEFKSVYQMLGF